MHTSNRFFPDVTFHGAEAATEAVLLKKGVLKSLAKFTGKDHCWRLQHRCFPVKFAQFSTTPFLQNTSGRLLLTKMLLKIYVSFFLLFPIHMEYDSPAKSHITVTEPLTN